MMSAEEQKSMAVLLFCLAAVVLAIALYYGADRLPAPWNYVLVILAAGGLLATLGRLLGFW